MEIVRAEILGYCMGVRRAVEMAEAALLNNSQKVFSLGPIIHNEAALFDLKKRGLFVLSENDLSDKLCCATAKPKLIIRAHGVPLQTEINLTKSGFKIIDATCPLVKRSQKIAAEYSQKGDVVILAGDKNHAEVMGIAGYAQQEFILIESANDARKIANSTKRAVLFSQTTFSETEFVKIADIIKEKFLHVEIINTICPATQERKKALEKLVLSVDGVLVVGSKNSANTQRLFALAQKLCHKASLIESAKDIPVEFFALKRVGLTAGASTPDKIISDVENELKARSV